MLGKIIGLCFRPLDVAQQENVVFHGKNIIMMVLQFFSRPAHNSRVICAKQK